MKTQSAQLNSYAKPLKIVALVTAGLLLIPIFGNLFIEGWQWGPGDFIFAAVMIFGFGAVYVLLAGTFKKPVARLVLAGVLFFVVAAIWAEAAVGAIEQTIKWIFG